MAYLRDRGEQRELEGSKSVLDWVSGDAGVLPNTRCGTPVQASEFYVTSGECYRISLGRGRSTCSSRLLQGIQDFVDNRC